MNKVFSYIISLIFLSLSKISFSMHESDSIKRDHWLTFSGIYIPHEYGGFLAFGLALEKTTVKPRITKVGSFYNTYNNHFKKEANNATRFTSLTYGITYNLLKKHKLNVGLQGGLFLRDAHLDFLGTSHGYGITVNPQLEFKYCFKKFEIGLDFLYFFVAGKFKTPIYGPIYPIPDEYDYETKYRIGHLGYYNFKISKKL